MDENITEAEDEIHVTHASSSSVYENNNGKWGPALAWKGGSAGFFHSNNENKPWLQIKLNRPTQITNVVVINRKDCCGERLQDLEVRAGMEPGLNNEVVGEFKGPGYTAGVHVIKCNALVVAQYLTFQLRGRGYLQINGIRLSQLLPGQPELPKIHLPGDEKFISYKNSLQCYCQKKRWSVPIYKPERENNGLVGTVSFNTSSIRCEEISGSVKEADAHAAYVALTQLGYLKDVKFDMMCNQLKRKNGGGDIPTTNIKRKPSTEPATWKSQLNELAQKRKLPLPTYTTDVVPGGFSSVVLFNHNPFSSLGVCLKRKDAEQNAAQVALNSLTGAPLPTQESMDTSDGHPAAAPPPISLKNRLQEYCQKQCKTLPEYDTHEIPDTNQTKTFQTTVKVNGVEYQGVAIKGKKNAETSAAYVALRELQLQVDY